MSFDYGTGDGVAEVPTHYEIAPNGDTNLVIGDDTRLADFNHEQGDNPEGYTNDCGLVSAQDVLNQFGIAVTEADVVEHADSNGECQRGDTPAESGGTTVDDQVRVLGDYGVAAEAGRDSSLEQLGEQVAEGRGVIVELNAGILWQDADAVENGAANHAVVVTGVACDPGTGAVQGFYINDSGNGQSDRYVDAATMTQAWLNTGGQAVVTQNAVPAHV